MMSELFVQAKFAAIEVVFCFETMGEDFSVAQETPLLRGEENPQLLEGMKTLTGNQPQSEDPAPLIPTPEDSSTSHTTITPKVTDTP